MPPIVACAEVLTSTGNQTPCGRSQALSASSTMPGSTVTVIASRSKATTPFRNLLWSMTSAAPTVCPHCELPPPRGSTGTPSCAADVDRHAHVLVRARNQHADRLDLVDRRVGRIAAARGAVEQDLALHGPAQAPREFGVARRMEHQRARQRSVHSAASGVQRLPLGTPTVEHRLALLLQVVPQDGAEARRRRAPRAPRPSPRARAPPCPICAGRSSSGSAGSRCAGSGSSTPASASRLRAARLMHWWISRLMR